MKTRPPLLCVLALVTAWTIGCPTPPDPTSPPPGGPNAGGPGGPNAGGPNAGGPGGPNAGGPNAGGPGGEGGTPGTPGGSGGPGGPGGEGGQPPGSAGNPPVGMNHSRFEEPTGPLPSFKDLIEGDKAITVTVSLEGIPADARGQVDFQITEDNAPRVLHVERYTSSGPVTIKAPAAYTGSLQITSHTYGEAPFISKPADITLGTEDIAVTVVLEPASAEDLAPPPGPPPGPPPSGNQPAENPDPGAPKTEGSAPSPAPGGAPAPEGAPPAPGHP